MNNVLFFKIEKHTESEYGRSYDHSVSYCTANNIQDVIDSFNKPVKTKSESYAKLSKHYRYDECEEVIEITLLEPEFIPKKEREDDY